MKVAMGGLKVRFCGELCAYTWLGRLLKRGAMTKLLALRGQMRETLVRQVEDAGIFASFCEPGDFEVEDDRG